MFCLFQVPLCDARPFLATTDHHKLPVPVWLTPDPESDFVREFGSVRHRRRGGIEGWPGENIYCDAGRALRFKAGLGTQDWMGGWSREPTCAFRRLMSDGRAASRLEIGFVQRSIATASNPATGAEVLEFARALLGLEVSVPADGAQREGCSLHQCGRRLSAHYLRSTTAHQRGETWPTEPWWVTPGWPLLVAVYELGGINPLPQHAERVDNLGEGTIKLSHVSLYIRGRRVEMWLLGTADEAPTDYLRRLRICLSRLHAERQCLSAMLRLVSRQRIAVVPDDPATDALTIYVLKSLQRLEREKRDGVTQLGITAIAREAQDLVAPGERDSLLEQLKRVRRNVLRRVRDVSEPEPAKEGNAYELSGDSIEVVTLKKTTRTLLFLTASPEGSDPLDTDEEGRRLYQTVRSKFDFRQYGAVRASDLSRYLRDYDPHILHFSGHGSPEGGLVLEDKIGWAKVVDPYGTAKLLAELKENIRCVFLNACYSKVQAEAIAQHIDTVIGMPGTIDDDVAISFAVSFYYGLVSGESVRKAFDVACGDANLVSRPGDETTPQLVERKGISAADIRF